MQEKFLWRQNIGDKFFVGEIFVRERVFIYSVIGIIFAIQLYEIHDLKSMLINRSFEENFISDDELNFLACRVNLTGEGVIIVMNDSSTVAKPGENPNAYVIHDDDILRVINELRAAGAEAISINGQRLIATSEIRCAGPTLSVNNVRSAAPYEICAIGDKKTLANAIKMRGGVEETLKVWGIKLDIKTSDKIFVPAYTGNAKNSYAKIAD